MHYHQRQKDESKKVKDSKSEEDAKRIFEESLKKSRK